MTLEVNHLDSRPATTSSKGIVQIGNNLNITNGIVNVHDADEENKGIMKLYQTRGVNEDGAVSQNVFENTLHELLDQIDSVYYRQDRTVLQAKCDEYGNRISESYVLKDSEKITQANKLNVVPDENNNEYHTFSFKINNTSYAFPPVSAWKLDTTADDDISQSLFTFDNSDATSFYYEPELNDDDPFRSIVFDSKMHLRKTYDLTFSTPETFRHGFISYSNIIPFSRFRNKYSIKVNSYYDDIIQYLN